MASTMNNVETRKYTIEEWEAATVLTELKLSQTIGYEPESELAITSPQPSTSRHDNIFIPTFHSTLKDPIPGPSSAPDVGISDRDSNIYSSPDRLKYKLSLFERYKEEQRQWALEDNKENEDDNYRVAFTIKRMSDADMPKENGESAQSTESLARIRNATPQNRVRHASRNSVNSMTSDDEYTMETDDSVSEEPVSDEPVSDEPVSEVETPQNSDKTLYKNIYVSKRLLAQLQKMTPNKATRKLLIEVFDRSILATHSLTGRPSPAFPNKPVKKRLNPGLVNTIIELVCDRCKASEKEVRMSITTKLADECKMMRTRERRESTR